MSEAQLILARTMYGEARGDGREGMQAVANVVMNRVAAGGWWGDSIIEVCLMRWQFSAWNASDPNRDLILSKLPGDGDPDFDLAYGIAESAIAGDLADLTNGATHYHAKYLNPDWAIGADLVADIGGHKFYSGVA